MCIPEQNRNISDYKISIVWQCSKYRQSISHRLENDCGRTLAGAEGAEVTKVADTPYSW